MEWIEATFKSIIGTSRTLKGISDTTSSNQKPKLLFSNKKEKLRKKSLENITKAIKYLYKNRYKKFENPTELREFIDKLAGIVNWGLLQKGQSIYRTWNTKVKHQIPCKDIEQEYKKFCDWLYNAIIDKEPVKTSALVEKRLDNEIHPFSDGCGRISKLLSSYVLFKGGLLPVKYSNREIYYKNIEKEEGEWIEYYRTFMREKRIAGKK